MTEGRKGRIIYPTSVNERRKCHPLSFSPSIGSVQSLAPWLCTKTTGNPKRVLKRKWEVLIQEWLARGVHGRYNRS